jgi:predicted lipoprotein with Yx(FWY)xxD motif
MRRILIVAVAIAGFAAAAVTGLAGAKTHRNTVKTAHNSKLNEKIVVGANGMTLYELSGETSHHLLCKSAQCLQFWPPVKVKSAKTTLSKASGIKGKLGTIHRHGFFQVTLGGRPLYYFFQDKAKGDANGQGINSFGGTWHVVKVSGGSSSSTDSSTTTMTPPPPSTTTNPYGY